jgi:hypothetical protein
VFAIAVPTSRADVVITLAPISSAAQHLPNGVQAGIDVALRGARDDPATRLETLADAVLRLSSLDGVEFDSFHFGSPLLLSYSLAATNWPHLPIVSQSVHRKSPAHPIVLAGSPRPGRSRRCPY